MPEFIGVLDLEVQNPYELIGFLDLAVEYGDSAIAILFLIHYCVLLLILMLIL